MSENWKHIKGFEGIYQISDKGNIRNRNNLILKQRTINSGYFVIKLYKGIENGKKIYIAKTVHRIVAENFIENPENKAFVNHKNGNKLDNNINNLEWVTPKENARHAVETGLHRTYVRTEEHKKNVSIRMSKANKGIKKSAEHNRKNSESKKGIVPRCILERNRKDFVKVMCVDDNKRFETIKDAADYMGVKKDVMWRHLRKGAKYESITKKFVIL